MAERACWRLIESGQCDPFANMATDEALLRGYRELASPPTLRLYGWERPSVSLGFSQDASRDLDTARCEREGVPVVRRLTGGGMIVHADELTYSLVCATADLGIPPGVATSYKIISSFLIAFYKKLGLNAAYACDAAPGERLGAPSAVCFAAREKYDIVVSGKKIGGSAQKRSGRVIFQHGSIPIRIDRTRVYARQAAAGMMSGAVSLEDLLGRAPGSDALAGLLVEAFRETFGVSVERWGLTPPEAALAEELRRGKYSTKEWNHGTLPDPAIVGQ